MNAFDIIPAHQIDRYTRLKHEAKVEYGKWAEAILAIAALKKGIGKAIAEWASKLGCSEGHVRRKFDEWQKLASWEVFVNKSLAGADWWETDKIVFDDEFINFVYGLFGKNQRGKCLTQYRALIRQWQAWRRGDLTKRIPGYDTPPVDCGCGHPAGWSYRNLMRQKPAAQRRLELALTNQGVAAALKLLPPIPGSRIGARPLEYVSIDDVWQDREILVRGYDQPARLLQMGGMDYASAVYLRFGLRPQLPTDKGTRERLKERDAKFLIAMILEKYGYPADYDMHIICERGTATIRPADARVLYDISGGRIKVCYTSMEGDLVLVWQETSSGNSRGKAWHESWHNLFHNEMAALRGQVGKDNESQPRALAAMQKEALSLATASHFLTPDQKRKLQMPFSSLEEAHFETIDIIDRINRRRDHDCEGFDTLMEWVLPGVQDEPQPEGALIRLDADLRSRIAWRPRVESPWERFAKLSQGVKFNRVPHGILCRFYEDSHYEKNIDGQRFAFVKDGKSYVFKPGATDQALPDGPKKYLGYFAPIDPDVIHLTFDGGYVATWVRERRNQRGDQKALAEAIREKTSLLNTTMATVRRQQADFIESEERRLRENNQVLAEAGLLTTDDEVLAHGHSAELGEDAPIPSGMAALQRAVLDTEKARAKVKKVKAEEAHVGEAASDWIMRSEEAPIIE